MRKKENEPGSDPRLLINIFKGSAMTKDEFFDYCRRHNASIGVELRITVEHQHREIYPVVKLHGTWGKYDDEDGEWMSFQSDVTLFTPQHRKDPCQTWVSTCEKRAAKFRRWLKQWLDDNPFDDGEPGDGSQMALSDEEISQKAYPR